MRKCIVSPEDATSFLSSLIGLTLNSFRCYDNSIIFSLGESYQVKTIVPSDDGWSESVTKTFAFEIAVFSISQIHFLSASGQPIPNTTGDYLIDSVVKDVFITQENVCILKMSAGTVEILPSENKTCSWCICQPKTEEDYLVLDNSLYKCVSESRRWSCQYAGQRGFWHPFPLTSREQYGPIDLLNISALNALIGTRFVYGIKSKDMNFYNLGFVSIHNDSDAYEFHITCRIQIDCQSGQSVVFWGDSDKNSFEQYISMFMNQAVLNIHLLDKNILKIEFKDASITVCPADDTKESWRLLLSNETHIIASNTWIVKTD